MRFPFFAACMVALWAAADLSSISQAKAQDSEAQDSGAPIADAEAAMLPQLDAPLLFVKRHSYTGIHIYDTYYKWPPGGGGIYVIENPAASRATWRVRPVIDPTTVETLGEGVYTHPELSWDATRLLFCFKGEPEGSTSIYEIGVDGTGLRRLTDPTPTCTDYKGNFRGQHDVAPAYLADGRIVFLSTRPSGLVPCNNTGVAIMHVMNADGSDIHPISVNNVNEFDPCPLPDGRILFGRWEYIDKNALTIQSLWTVNPDGTQETAFYANNMVFPEAILDARPVPNSPFIVGTFAKHNSTPRGSIALVDSRRGKNSIDAIVNLEHPDQPTTDTGDSCEPWPISEDLILFSGRPAGSSRNVLELIDRAGHRVVLHSDPAICLHSPMLVKPRSVPMSIVDTTDRSQRSGRFYLQDIYDGLPNVKRGTVKWLRVLEETSRTSARPDGANPFNQTFLISSALAFSVKNYLGIVPVEPDGSAYFEIPAGRAVYLQALDNDGRLVHSMRSFVQAAPGTTRSCIGCHEHKQTSARSVTEIPAVLLREPSQLQPESWGSGYLDYASMVQPILNKYCVRCHGGKEGINNGVDLSGGWTEHFNISYETLTNRCETQLTAYWIAGIDCMNGTALWSSQIFPPRSHGSGGAPLAKLLLSEHEGRICDMTRPERDLLMAWMDSNGVYYGTWNRTASGCAIPNWNALRQSLTEEMRSAGCLECHGQDGKLLYFENDWVNLEQPHYSRILRAPLAKRGPGHGLEWCRQRKVTPDRQRVHLLWNGYAHAVQPPEAFERHERVMPNRDGDSVVSFASAEDLHYQAMLRIIRDARETSLAVARVDMPGAEILAGDCRLFCPPEVEPGALALEAAINDSGAVQLSWPRSANTIGLQFELHRSTEANFVPDASTLLTQTPLFTYTDWQSPPGVQHYAVVSVAKEARGEPSYSAIDVPLSLPPGAPSDLHIAPASGVVHLDWSAPAESVAGYHVFRYKAGSDQPEQLTTEPVRRSEYCDLQVEPDQPYRYVVRAINRRMELGAPSEGVEATAHFVLPPVLSLSLETAPRAELLDGTTLTGTLQGGAVVEQNAVNLLQAGYVTIPHDPCVELLQPLTVQCRVWFTEPGEMPVVISCGAWNQAGWFIQRLGNSWRWHVGGVDCDGGKPDIGRWIHLVGTFDGRNARLYQDGSLVGERAGPFQLAIWPGDLHIGQYSDSPTPAYQVIGRIKDVKIFHRPLGDAEIAESAAAGQVSGVADPSHPEIATK
ncbi:MAG: HzsA-related protein [Pirellulaceae bacterium]